MIRLHDCGVRTLADRRGTRTRVFVYVADKNRAIRRESAGCRGEYQRPYGACISDPTAQATALPAAELNRLRHAEHYTPMPHDFILQRLRLRIVFLERLKQPIGFRKSVQRALGRHRAGFQAFFLRR